jgi:DUF971 family protein
MAGLDSTTPFPESITLHEASCRLEVRFDNGKAFVFSFEFLRVHSPSASVRGHGDGPTVLQTGKREVRIDGLEPVGHYAIKPVFSDGHDSGLYSWDYLYWLGENQETLWEGYLHRLAHEGGRRDPD